MALVGMEQPLSLTAEHIRQEKVKLLQAVQPLEMSNLLIGQFTSDPSKKHPGYLDDHTIQDKTTTTETYATAVLNINNPRWFGVPFILKAGKVISVTIIFIVLLSQLLIPTPSLAVSSRRSMSPR